MNTAIFSARVHFHGTFWVVVVGDRAYTCLNFAQLTEALKGRPIQHPEPPPPPARETVEQFIARGGVITKIGKPKPVPLPKPAPEHAIKTPTRVTLADLGF